MVDFGKSTRIKAALVMPQLNINGTDLLIKEQWYLTFGSSASPCTNPTIVTWAWGLEILIERNARYLAVCKETGSLNLALVSIFKYPCD